MKRPKRQTRKPQAPKFHPKDLCGTWELFKYEILGPARKGRPDPKRLKLKGVIHYNPNGWMVVSIVPSAKLSRADRKRFSIGYGGPYRISRGGKTISHHVEFALNPAWISTTLKRRILSHSRTRMVLETPPFADGARHRVTWRRVA